MAPKAKSSNEKMSNVAQLDFHKVRNTMKRLNLKKMDRKTVEKIADELKYPLKDIKHQRHLSGKMLASIKTWDKEY